MARAGRVQLDVNWSAFNQSCEATISRVQRGTKIATQAAVDEIRERSLREVPRETNTLADSWFENIVGTSANFSADFGYGGANNPINPKSGQRASDYMVVVHEDLEAKHPIGKAKFLEDPIRDYQSQFGSRFVSILRRETGIRG